MKKPNEFVQPQTPPENNEHVKDWIAEKMKEIAQAVSDANETTYLLAHADDGVIWGKWANDELQNSNKVDPNRADPRKRISPELRGITLQQAFIFNTACEIRLFRDELGDWQACKIEDHCVDEKDCIDELQILWGDDEKAVHDLGNDFTHVRDKKQQGLDQILPKKITKDNLIAGERVRLRVRHFITCNEETGEARIGLSRLVNVEVVDAAQA